MLTDKQLQIWANSQRCAYRQGRLSKTSVRKLEALPRWFWRRKTLTVDEWVTVAEQLARENGGRIPSTIQLVKTGRYALIAIMRKYPEKFEHLSQDRLIKTPDEWVPVAEDMAAKNEGTLPSVGRLQKTGYSGLAAAMRNHHEKFTHIKQEDPSKTIDEWITYAEELAANNDGGFPPCAQLSSGLREMLRKYPERFTHIKLNRKRKPPNEWVPIAKKLAKANHGWLPTYQALRRQGHHGLLNAMSRHPELFARIRQEKVEFADAWKYRKDRKV